MSARPVFLLLLPVLAAVPLLALGSEAVPPAEAPASEAAEPAEAASPPPAAPPEAPEPPALPPAELSFQIEALVLPSRVAGQQLVLTDAAGGRERDVTGLAVFEVRPEGVVAVDSRGYLTPLGDGEAELFATLPGTSGEPASLRVSVSGFEIDPPVHFSQDVVAVFTKHGCNGGGCHGKSGGQNDFRLSLFGYEPWHDHDWLVREARGRRLSPAAPEHSLVLMKATGELPHEGGIRLEKGAPDYETIVRWIRQGMPDDPEDAPRVERIEVFPSDRVADPHSGQQLAVTAWLSDGSRRDITRLAIFEANQEDMAEVDEFGHVTLLDKTGTASIMVRFQEHVDVFRATVPLGVEMPALSGPANFVDEHVFAKLTMLGLPPSGPAGDAVFLRRVTVDIAGRLPTAEESRAFLASADPDKRETKIDELLDSADYAAYFAQKWAGILRNKRAKDTYQRGTYGFHDWLREAMQDNLPYDRFVAELITASGEIGRNPAVGWFRAVPDQNEHMQDIAQVFLGIRMQCAQCHHHPYERWSQDDYYAFSAFLSAVGRKPGEQPDELVVHHRHVVATMQNPNTGVELRPAPLGSEPLEIPAESDPRRELASWLVSEDNTWFAKMLVNRYWKHFFGVGLVDPEDDMRVTNPASHPELLDALAGHFVASGFDLKELVRVLCRSRTYQLSAVPNEHNLADTQNFSRYYPKRLQAEVLLDAVNTVTGSRDTFRNQPEGIRATWLPDDKFNADSYFLSVFGRPEMDSACECERVADANLAQSLHLINSDTMHEKLGGEGGRAAALAAERDRSDEERVVEIYLNALAREPNRAELEAACAHLEKKRNRADAEGESAEEVVLRAEREAFEDILWALVNTKEFLFNH